MRKGIIRRLGAGVLALLMTGTVYLCPVAAENSFEKPKLKTVKLVEEVLPDGSVVNPYYVDADGNRIQSTSLRTPMVEAAASTVPSSYDLRDEGRVTEIRDQGLANNCWAFSTLAAIESNYITNGYGTAENTDFSETHLVYFSMRQKDTDRTSPFYNDGVYVANPYATAGRWREAANALLNGVGAQLEENAPWNLKIGPNYVEVLDESTRYVSYARLKSAVQLNAMTATQIKSYLMEKGSVAVSYFDDSGGKVGAGSYNPTTNAYYQKTKINTTNHRVQIIGWDDNYAITNFRSACRPSHPGAWLCKNSWGTKWQGTGFTWISYDDPSLTEFVGFETALAEEYNHIYAYDGTSPSNTYYVESGAAKMANTFVATSEQVLTQVVFYSPNFDPVNAFVSVYKGKSKMSDDPTVHTVHQPGDMFMSNIRYGYNNIKLDHPVHLYKGEVFTIVVELATHEEGKPVLIPIEGSGGGGTSVNDRSFGSRSGQSFVCYEGIWFDTTKDLDENNNNNVPIKAMTVDADLYYENHAPEYIYISSEPLKKDYEVGDEIDLSGLTIRARYDDDSETTVHAYTTDLHFVEKPGPQEVKVTCHFGQKDFSVTFMINVEQSSRVLTEVRAEDVPSSIFEDNDGTLELGNLKLRAYYDNGTSRLVTDYEVWKIEESYYTITLRLIFEENGVEKYTEITKPVQRPVTFSGVEIVNAPEVIRVLPNGSVDLSDFSLNLCYSDGTKTTTAAGFYATYERMPDGFLVMTIYYSENGILQSCNYQAPAQWVPALVSVEPVEVPKTIIIHPNGEPDFSQLQVIAYYSDQTTESITDYDLSYEILESGEIAVTLTFSKDGVTQTKTFTTETYYEPITPSCVKPVSIPEKIIVYPDGTVDFGGLQLLVNYNDGTTTTSDEFRYTITPLEVGGVEVTIYYTEGNVVQKCSFRTEAEYKVLLMDIVVPEVPNLVTVHANGQVDFGDMQVVAIYSNQTTEVITDYTFEINKLADGSSEIKLHYTVEDVEVEYTFKTEVYYEPVELQRIAPVTVPKQIHILENGKPDLSGLVIRAYYNDDTYEDITNFSSSVLTLPDGTLQVTVMYMDNGVQKNCIFTASPAVMTGLELSDTPSLVTISGGEVKVGNLSVRATYSDGYSKLVTDYTLSYKQSGDSVTVTVTWTEGENTLSRSFTAKVIRVTAVRVKGDANLVFKKGGKLSADIQKNGNPSCKTTWTSSNPNIVQVQSDGTLKAVKNGTATITVTVTDEYGNTVTAKQQVTVKYAWWQYLILIFLLGFIWYK